MSDEEATRALLEALKNERPRLVGALVRVLRDLDHAEEILADTTVIALQEWPERGVPERPGAWLMTTAKNRALNSLRNRRRRAQKQEEIALGEKALSSDFEESVLRELDRDVFDDSLRLLFIACHPELPKEGRVALTLRMIGGLTTEEIARAFLVADTTIAQRIVRAKRTIEERSLAFELPSPEELSLRLASVLEVIYLIFNEGYAATAGSEVIRSGLVDEARRLAQLLVRLAPGEPEVLALSALLELQSSRLRARTDPQGDPILLADQDRRLWDAERIAAGLGLLATAAPFGPAGSYRIQAEIAACHAEAASVDETDWARIARLYDELLRHQPTPVIYLNRALAVSKADGPAAGLRLLDELRAEPALERYHLLPAARAEMLQQLGFREAARLEFLRAAQLAENERTIKRLLSRAAALEDSLQN